MVGALHSIDVFRVAEKNNPKTDSIDKLMTKLKFLKDESKVEQTIEEEEEEVKESFKQ